MAFYAAVRKLLTHSS